MYFLILHANLQVELANQEPPSGVHWKRQVYLVETFAKNQQYITLVSCRKHTPYILPPPPQRFRCPLLKSNLQKAIRRGNVDAAVATAWQLACQGSEERQELFRRLPIILLEDGFLNTHILPRLLWWLLATGKGWALSEDEWQRFLLDVAAIANIDFCPWREDVHRIVTNTSIPIDSLFDAPSSHQRTTALFAIWLRSRWGGMLGDIGMLRGLFHLWMSRDSEAWSMAEQDPAESLLILAPLDTLHFDVTQHALPEAVDHHCVSHMSFELSQLAFAPKQDIEKALWLYRSRLNFRRVFRAYQQVTNDTDVASQNLFRRIEMYLASFVRKAWLPVIDTKKKQQRSMWHFIREI
jgi:hypothetical protein